MKDRIAYLMKQEGVTQQQFAEKIGISAASLSGILNGRTQPTSKCAGGIHQAFPNVSLAWLMFGEGEMYVEAEKKSMDIAPTLFPEDDEIEVPAKTNVAPTTVASQTIREIVYRDKPPRQITEIRIFFDDGTYETYGKSLKADKP